MDKGHSKPLQKESPTNKGNPTISNSKYHELKQALISKEETNYDKIYVIPCSGDQGWHELADHSALIYYYIIYGDRGLPISFHEDATGYFLEYNIGYIRIRNLTNLETNIKNSKLLSYHEVKDHCHIFHLKRHFTKKEMDELKTAEIVRRNENNNILGITYIDPIFHQKATEIAIRLHKICHSRMDRLASQTTGVRMITLIDSVIANYISICNHKYQIVPIEEWQKISKSLDSLELELALAATVKIWPRETSISIVGDIRKLKYRIRANIKKSAAQLERLEVKPSPRPHPKPPKSRPKNNQGTLF